VIPINHVRIVDRQPAARGVTSEMSTLAAIAFARPSTDTLVLSGHEHTTGVDSSRAATHRQLCFTCAEQQRRDLEQGLQPLHEGRGVPAVYDPVVEAR
jgi:hypothetical protein